MDKKYEYMIHIWGGMFNKDAYPSITKDLGITEGYYYFDTKEERQAFKDKITEEYRSQGFASDSQEGYLTHKQTVFVGTFEYEGKQYILHENFGYEYPEEVAIFMFEEGNYSCDCNRSIFINREYGTNINPNCKCGEDIKLIDFHIEYID